ncbi:MAG TPA: Nramp family divalent metal transporter [Stellaceae bacterium]|jgi:NRAMP (natural resistance-associated macrophage protein)-like metal ion transporter|nr:Nramp family divalent metal transporter [Stellaceae bacterium]
MSGSAKAARARRRRRPRRRIWQWLGPGLITGASDDDPSGIATYSQVGAQFGYGMTWVMLFSFPLMAAIQEVCARIGRVTGEGIAGNLRRYYPAWLLRLMVGLLLVANVINLGADLGAMGDALYLVLGGAPKLLYVVLFGALCVGLEIFMQYRNYVNVLKWTTIALFSYFITAMVVDVPWLQVLHDTIVPSISLETKYIVSIVAVMGTTISPYLFFWQSSQEAEDERVDPLAHPLVDAPSEAPAEIRRIRIDTYLGMGFSNLISLFIIITAAATLGAHGITDIETSAQAAEALRPIAGEFAFLVFALGIVGTGLLAVPVLAGSAAYAVGEALQWPTGLARFPMEARAFYGTIAFATAVGVAINFVGVDPIKALFWTAVLNGVIAVPLMVVSMIMAMSRRVMGRFVLPKPLAVMGWLATAVMTVIVAAMFLTWNQQG